MRTRDVFTIQANIYQTEVRRRWLLLSPVVIMLVTCYILVDGNLVTAQGPYASWKNPAHLAFLAVIVAAWHYLRKSRQSLARKCEMACPACGHAFERREITVVETTGQCPDCKSPIFS